MLRYFPSKQDRTRKKTDRFTPPPPPPPPPPRTRNILYLMSRRFSRTIFKEGFSPKGSFAMIPRRSAPFLGLNTGKNLRVKLDNGWPIDTRPTDRQQRQQLTGLSSREHRSIAIRPRPPPLRRCSIPMETSLRVAARIRRKRDKIFLRYSRYLIFCSSLSSSLQIWE